MLAGLPVLTVATVRSVSHVSSLSVYSTTHAPGEKPTLERVYEQRVTALAVHIMMGKYCLYMTKTSCVGTVFLGKTLQTQLHQIYS